MDGRFLFTMECVMTASPSASSLIPTFNPDLHWHVGIEQEFFLTRRGSPVPDSPAFLHALARLHPPHSFVDAGSWRIELVSDPFAQEDVDAWTYEFSACQVEVRTQPHASLDPIHTDLHRRDIHGMEAARAIDTTLIRLEVAPANMPMDHYRCERYDRLSKIIPPDVLLAAFRVAGTHFHIGMSCIQEAVEVHDALCAHLSEIAAMGDHSHGERLHLYHQVVSWAMPRALVPIVGTSPAYGSKQGWLDYLHTAGVDELRSCWDLVRITRHGTVELRVLGVGENIDEILSWVERVYSLLGRKIG